MKKINCDQCGTFLFETEKSWGAAGSEAMSKGFVFKLPVMFTDKYPRLFFCNSGCGKVFYKENIPKNPEATKAIGEAKAKIPEHAKECAKGLSDLSNILKSR